MGQDRYGGRRTGKARHRFLRNADGSVAIEFSFLAIPFFLLLFAILESCISYAAQQMLSNSADRVARLVRTGQVKAPINEQQLHDMICESLQIIVPEGCPQLVVDLRHYDTFMAAAKERVKISGGDIDTSGFAVDPGESGTINMLRVFYRWPVFTDLLRKPLSNLNDGRTLHFASVTWQNEPFDDL